MKMGFAGDNFPKASFASLVGRPMLRFEESLGEGVQLKIGRIQYGMQALMSLFAEGMMTAMLLDSGDGVTHCIPVFEGSLIKSAFERLEIAGRHVTNHFIKLLHQRGYAFNSTSDF
ncbi:unnamed protein product [Sphagnum balticum]